MVYRSNRCLATLRPSLLGNANGPLVPSLFIDAKDPFYMISYERKPWHYAHESHAMWLGPYPVS